MADWKGTRTAQNRSGSSESAPGAAVFTVAEKSSVRYGESRGVQINQALGPMENPSQSKKAVTVQGDAVIIETCRQGRKHTSIIPLYKLIKPRKEGKWA